MFVSIFTLHEKKIQPNLTAGKQLAQKYTLNTRTTQLILILFLQRLHNKKYYVQLGLRKIMSRGSDKDFFNRNVTLEVDGRRIDLPSIEGIIILNILRFVNLLTLH